MTRKGIDVSSLSDFAPREEPAPRVERPGDWPSREPAPEPAKEEPMGQFTIRAKTRTIERFRQMCKRGRATMTYEALLEELMDEFQQEGKDG